jgi:hypothetical protein
MRPTTAAGHRFGRLLVGLFLLLSAFAHPLGVATARAEQSSTGAASGAYLADLGFRPNLHGFSFENYGRAPDSDLTAEELRRMFGDGVCNSTANGKCTLTPLARAWMADVNRAMSGGHCMGMAKLSLLMYLGKVRAADFGGLQAADLRLQGNLKLQREIAYWWATQTTIPAILSDRRDLTPNEVVDKLVESFKAGPSAPETYSLGIFKRKPPFGGHAILPYAVEDRGGGVVRIMVYDNNWPGEERYIEVDRNANSWRYFAATNPSERGSLYEGDASTGSLELLPVSQRLVQQACPFCADDGNSTSPKYEQLWLEGGGHLLLTDAQGRRFGYLNGDLVREIPGVSYSLGIGAASWLGDDDPVYFVPVGMPLTVTVDGTGLTAATDVDVTLAGPGYLMSVQGIYLHPGTRDMLNLAPGPNGGTVSYTTPDDESPDIVIGLDHKDADYSFAINGAELKGGGTIEVSLDKLKGQLKVKVTGSKGPGYYAIELERAIDDDVQLFAHDEVELSPGDVAYLNFGRWRGDGDSIPLAIDRGGDGSIDDTVDLTDE